MALERTLSIVKPDAVAANATGRILAMFEEAGLRPIAIRTVRLTTEQAQAFYAVHTARPFFGDLVKFMTSGPVCVSVLEGENAIVRNREVMGPTDSKKAAAGTVRGRFGTDIEKNAVHGSDAPETAAVEVGFFFSGAELASLAR